MTTMTTRMDRLAADLMPVITRLLRCGHVTAAAAVVHAHSEEAESALWADIRHPVPVSVPVIGTLMGPGEGPATASLRLMQAAR